MSNYYEYISPIFFVVFWKPPLYRETETSENARRKKTREKNGKVFFMAFFYSPYRETRAQKRTKHQNK
jgi:hypothetical protein